MANLTGQSVYLRGLEPDDLDKLYIWENDTTLWPFGSTRAPLTRHQLWQYIDNYDGDIFAQRQLRLMIVEVKSDQTIGTIDLYDYDPRDGHAMVGIFIDSSYRQYGYATEAIGLIEEYARQTVGMHQLAAKVCVDNTPSISLFKKAGFKSRACLRSWVKQGRHYSDVIIFQKLFE